MASALSGMRIVEIGENVSAPYATKLLGDLGADVIKIELFPSGDPLRWTGTFPTDDGLDATIGGLFQYLNANKRSVACDVNASDGRRTILDIVAEADVIIENLGAGVLESLKLGQSELRAANPRIVLVRISDFGQDGPWSHIPATDFIVQAASGWISKHNTAGLHPVQLSGGVTDYACGVHAAVAALAAFKTATDLEEFVSVDISKQECLLSLLSEPAIFYVTRKILGRGDPEDDIFPVPGIVRCKDGFVGMNVLSAQHWSDCCHMIGVPHYIPKQLELRAEGPVLAQFYQDIEPWLMEHSADYIVQLAQDFRIPVARVRCGRDLPDIPQAQARKFYVNGSESRLLQPGFPYRLETTPASIRKGAPQLAEHNSDVARNPWKERPSPKTVHRSTRTEPYYPLKGLRVVDMGIMWAGPYVGCYLGSVGADVVKVESIQRPDGFRYTHTSPELGADWYERSGLWQNTNLNKRDLTLDLNRTEGKAVFESLIQKADVLIENFAPRVMENFGYRSEHFKKLNPELIIVRMPGFGLEGPWRDFVSIAPTLEQISGLAWVSGWSSGNPVSGGGFIDPLAAMHALVALLAAIQYRQSTGKGQTIEVAQFEVAAAMSAEQVIAWSMAGKVPGRHGNRSEKYAPQGVYQCLDGNRVAISIRNDVEWQRLVSIIGTSSWAASEKYSSITGRRERHDELDRLLAEWIAPYGGDDIAFRLRAAGIPAARVLRASQIYEDPQLSARAFYQEFQHPICGSRRYHRFPMRQSPGTEGLHRFLAPSLGEHNIEILSELGLSGDEIDQLQKKEIIGRIPTGLS